MVKVIELRYKKLQGTKSFLKFFYMVKRIKKFRRLLYDMAKRQTSVKNKFLPRFTLTKEQK